MAKKYLGLDEAAARLGMSTEELIRRRERGEIRGYADRGTWKFKSDDVEEFARRRQTDSDPEVPILADSDVDPAGGSSVFSGEEDLGEQPTVIRGKSGIRRDPGSDSDVRLILDDSLLDNLNEGSGVSSLGSLLDSDSDVRLVDEPGRRGYSTSDSDVQLVGSDTESDVQFFDQGDLDSLGEHSDSDVKIIGPSAGAEDGSDSDVALIPPDGSGIGINFDDDDDDTASVLSDASGILFGGDSSLSLASESGISLETLDDSGLSLEQVDSDITLDEGSGLAFDDGVLSDEESGLSLADDSGLGETSGISLAPSDSGLSLESIPSAVEHDLHATVPMMDAANFDDDFEATQPEVPALGDDSSYELQLGGEDEDSSVLLFDEEATDDFAPTMVKKSRDAELDELDDIAGESFDLEEADEFAEVEVEEGEFDDELEVADDILGEDDELDDLDVFDAGDEDFDDALETGESRAAFVAPRMEAPAVLPAEWGAGAFVGLLFSTGLLALSGMVMFDLVRAMWAWEQSVKYHSGLLEMLRGFYTG